MTTRAPAALADEPPAVVMKTWPHSARSVSEARHFLVRHLDAWGLPHLADAAEVVVSELVTNAVRHAGSPPGRLIGTRIERLASGVRIEVHDASEHKPERQEVHTDSESGRGLVLVDLLTGGHWGVSVREGPGKTVWAVCADDDVIEDPR